MSFDVVPIEPAIGQQGAQDEQPQRRSETFEQLERILRVDLLRVTEHGDQLALWHHKVVVDYLVSVSGQREDMRDEVGLLGGVNVNTISSIVGNRSTSTWYLLLEQ